MAKANSSFSEVQIARRSKEGRGQGHGKKKSLHQVVPTVFILIKRDEFIICSSESR